MLFREAREESGYEISIVNPVAQAAKVKNSSTVQQQPMPIAILYETVPFKTGVHRHFDMIYLAHPKGRRGTIAKGESHDFRWISRRKSMAWIRIRQ